MKCPYCNSEISDNSMFCGSCGKKLPQQKECVKCGKIIDDISDYCPYCGAKQNPSVSTPTTGQKPPISPSKEKRSKSSSKVIPLLLLWC